MTNPTMSKSDREDLQRLIRQRERVLKSAAELRSAELLSDFENQMGHKYSFDQDEIWERAVETVQPLVAKAQQQIAARCRELGIPADFAPSVGLEWNARGYNNTVEARRKELRVMATTKIAALEAKALVKIGLDCLAAQTAIASAGLASDAARAFLEKLPDVETLMPALSFTELAGEADPPIAQQLVSSNALRQRRHRERQRLAVTGVTPDRYSNAADGDGDGGDDDGEE